MDQRRLGRTGLRVPRLGFGGLGVTDRYMRRWGKDGSTTAESVITAAFDSGIRLFETARWYGDSEARIGAVLQDRCTECCFVSKTLRRDAVGALVDVDESLCALRVDYIDVYMIHHIQWEEELESVLSTGGALEGLREAQAEGKIGSVGVAGHRPEILCSALATDEFDVVEVPCNVLDPWIFHTVSLVARRFDVGIIAVKALAGGQLSGHAVVALQFALGQPYDSLVVGMSTLEQVQADVTEAVLFDQMSASDQGQLVERALCLRDGVCRLDCSERCVSLCPHRVPIADILRLERYRAVYKSGHWAKIQYRRLGLPAAACSTCSVRCGEACPSGLPVGELLRDAHKALSAPITDYEIAQHGGKGAIVKEIAA